MVQLCIFIPVISASGRTLVRAADGCRSGSAESCKGPAMQPRYSELHPGHLGFLAAEFQDAVAK